MTRDKFIFICRWVAISTLIGLIAGTLSAIFLSTLALMTRTREAHPLLIWFLPVGGFLVAWLYRRFGPSVQTGTNLILDEIHKPDQTVPFRMIPLVLLGTWLTHLFGGSAGREGTAVQMGASAADQLTRRLKFTEEERTTLLMAGMAAGFGSVFGVPFAGAIFGIEILAVGRFRFRSAPECLLASFVAHLTTLAFGIQHTSYSSPLISSVSLLVILSVLGAGILFGICAQAFSRGLHLADRFFKHLIQYAPLRAFAGGVIVLIGYRLLGTTRYAGLGLPVIEDSLKTLTPAADFLWKSVFTILTLGSGMKGGEVTPLLFIGSTLGNALSALLPVGFSLLAALGFVSVFAGAANTPLACTVMAMELFGIRIGLFALLACYASYCVSGYRGIYHSQRIARPKLLTRLLDRTKSSAARR